MRNNKLVTHKGTEVTPLRFVKWWITILILTHITVVTPILMAYLQINPIAIYSNQYSATTSILLTLGISSIILAGTAYLYYVRNLPKAGQPITPKYLAPIPSKVTTKEMPTEIMPPRSITDGVQLNYLKPGSKAEDIMVGDKPAKLYKMDDIMFNLRTSPHFLASGMTGAGKTNLSYALIKLFNKQLRYPMAVVLDFGNMDFPSAIATTTEDAIEVFNMIYYIVKGRQQEPKDSNFKDVLICFEEFESFMVTINTILNKKQYSDFLMKLSNMILVSRKVGVNFLFICQSARGNEIPIAIRNNLNNRLMLRLSKTAARMHGSPYDLSGLPSGTAYYEQIDAFLDVPFIEKQPPLNALTWDQLKAYSDGYKRKYNLNLDVTD